MDKGFQIITIQNKDGDFVEISGILQAGDECLAAETRTGNLDGLRTQLERARESVNELGKGKGGMMAFVASDSTGSVEKKIAKVASLENTSEEFRIIARRLWMQHHDLRIP